MARREQTFTKTEYGQTYTAAAYSTDGGRTWRWKSNDQYCPLDACVGYGVPCDPAEQESARSAQVGAFLEEYRARQKRQAPTAEERCEMRAAFGAGHELVDVVTGRRYTT